MEMKQMLFICAVLLLSMAVDEGYCWGFRGPRWRAPRLLRHVCNPVCTTKCVVATDCPSCAPVCSYGCGKTICKWIGRKRRGNKVFEDDKSGTFLVTLPCKFEAWDINKDGGITIDEFAFAGHAGDKDGKTIKMFSKIDKNGDKIISEAELDQAPLLREKC